MPTCQIQYCGERREVLMTRDSDGVQAEFCRWHAESYGLRAEGTWDRGFSYEPLIAGLAACPRCGRLVMGNGTARHSYRTKLHRLGASPGCGE